MALHKNEEIELSLRALNLRRHVLRMLKAAGSGHLGGALSAAELMTVLFFKVMNIRADDPGMPDRDRFVLSAGHKCLILYAALAEKGFFEKEILDTYGDLDAKIPGHPSMYKLPGIEANTGALGHGLSLAGGMALGLRLQGSSSRVYTIMGDGELAEGSNWEAAAAASHHKLDNLVAVVDRNGLQIGGSTRDIMSYEPLADRWKAFGWSVRTIDGHDLNVVSNTFESAPFEPGKPSLIIANTVKSRGFKFAEGQTEYHYWKTNPGQVAEAEKDMDALEEELKEQLGGVNGQ